MKTFRTHRAAGFTLVEMLISMTIAMVLLIGAFFSTSETYAVVRQGDARVHTQVHARRTLERMTKDCRYASSVEISGSEDVSWTLSLTTGLDSDEWVWKWSSSTEILTVSDGVQIEDVVTGITAFAIDTEINDEGDISRVALKWTLRENQGSEAGQGGSSPFVDLAASTWVRKAVD
jgi:type II secretory pathway pseudopilin PulG